MRSKSSSIKITNSVRWIGRDAVPALLADVFGIEDRTQLKQGKASLPLLDNEYSERVRAGTLHQGYAQDHNS